MTLHIVHVLNKEVPPTGGDGGAPQSVTWLAEEQVRHGHKVSIISPKGHSTAGFHHIRATPALKAEDLVRLLPPAVDVVHVHTCSESLDCALMNAKVPHVTHIRGNHIGPEIALHNRIYVSRSHAANHGSSHFVYNGLPLDQYPYRPEKGGSLLFLGKVRRSKKGIDAAVRVARGAGLPLVVAGGWRLATPATWWPFSSGVRSVGVVYGEQKMKLLASARALLFPIRWEEPFGLVLIEAMACGTPVIGFRRGAVEEIVVDGVSGFVCAGEQAMEEAVERLSIIDPHQCREHVQANFSIGRTYEACLSYYRRAQAGEIW